MTSRTESHGTNPVGSVLLPPEGGAPFLVRMTKKGGLAPTHIYAWGRGLLQPRGATPVKLAREGDRDNVEVLPSKKPCVKRKDFQPVSLMRTGLPSYAPQ